MKPHVSPRAIAGGLLLVTIANVGAQTGGKRMSLKVSSSAFSPNGKIPAKYTCEGADVSPPLAWSGIPPGAKSLALIVDDPDAPDPRAPKMTWVHWVLYDLPVSAVGLPEAVQKNALPAGTREGLNDWKRTGYGGPCPPIGEHRYFFKLYALDTVLPDLGTPTKAQLEKAMQGHVLAQAELVGTYEKAKR
jgi:Raf kinase inhibitor-like YbhB/YbcL family protein